MVIDIIRSIYKSNKGKIYVFTSLKLFMFTCLFYFIGMFVVLLHLEYFNGSKKIIHEYEKIKMPDKMQKVLCGGEAFINLFSYCVRNY